MTLVPMTPEKIETVTMLSAVVNAAPDGLLIVNAEGLILLVSDQVEELFGYTRDQLLGRPVEVLLPAVTRAVHVVHRSRYVAHPAVRSMGSGLALAGGRADGTAFAAEVSLSPLVIEDETLVIAAVRDISDRLELEDAARTVEVRNRLLEERDRMATELHDTVVQRIFASGMRIESVISSVESRVADRLGAVVAELDETMRELRSAIVGLQAHRDWDKGVRGRLLELVREESDHLGFEPQVGFVGDVDGLPAEVIEHLISTLRQALSNVARHAEATSASVQIEVVPRLLVATVTDNGSGMAPDVAYSGGLNTVRRHAQELSGDLSIGSEPGAGTVLVWSVHTGAKPDELDPDQ